MSNFDKLCERLEEHRIVHIQVSDDDEPYETVTRDRGPVNRDGPEAASAIRTLDAKVQATLDGGRPLPFSRDALGSLVRDAWIRWALTQPSPKPSWLVPYDELPEADKEADRQIGESIARWTLVGDAARASLS